MDGILAQRLAGALRQPQGVLDQPATVNPLMLAKALRQREQMEPPTSVMDQRWDAFQRNQNQADTFLTAADLIASASMLAPLAKPAAMALGRAAAPMAENYMAKTGMLQPMDVWHGSPHRFAPEPGYPLGRFRSDKIGTGEGAQAYGPGHYLAEAPDVARGYAINLANRDSANGLRLNAHANAQRLAKLAGDPKYAADDIRYALEINPQNEQAQLLKETLAMLESGAYAKPLQNSGFLYKVDLPDDQIARMLDWDKPLSQQPEVLKKIFDNGLQHGLYRQSSSKNIGDFTGADLVRSLGGDARASKELNGLGIPGIRYLDQGSRGAGQGTSNFVVFDDAIPKILSRE